MHCCYYSRIHPVLTNKIHYTKGRAMQETNYVFRSISLQHGWQHFILSSMTTNEAFKELHQWPDHSCWVRVNHYLTTLWAFFYYSKYVEFQFKTEAGWQSLILPLHLVQEIMREKRIAQRKKCPVSSLTVSNTAIRSREKRKGKRTIAFDV